MTSSISFIPDPCLPYVYEFEMYDDGSAINSALFTVDTASNPKTLTTYTDDFANSDPYHNDINFVVYYASSINKFKV